MIQKQNVNINFSQGLDTKTDPFQVPLGKFLSLDNSIFTKGGLLQKRNGYAPLPSLPIPATYVTTFNGNLTAIGTSIQALSEGSNSWLNIGKLQPLSLSVLPAIRSAISQTQTDSVTASNGLTCIAYTEINGVTPSYRYAIQDSVTGQNVVLPTVIPPGAGVVTGSPRCFLLGGYFIVVFTNVIAGVSHLQYIAISVSMPTAVTVAADIASSYTSNPALSWDGVVVGNKLFVAYNTVTGGQQVKITYLTSSLLVAAPQSFAGATATTMSVCADLTNPAKPVIYAPFYDIASNSGYIVAVDQNLNTLMTQTNIILATAVKNITATALSGICTVSYEVTNAYAYDGAIPTNFLDKVQVTLPGAVAPGIVGATTTFVRSVGLASKAFLMNGLMYVLSVYQSPLQSTYFLIDINGNVISKFSYENAGGYLTVGLPQAEVIGALVKVSYLFKDLIQATANSLGSQGAPNQTHFYSQTGINVGSLNFTDATLSSSEIGTNLNISGGMMWAYDGQTINEQGFHLFPDSIECIWATPGGAMAAKPDGVTNTNAYYYRVTYEWTDSQGNIFRSAPSVPVGVTTTGAGLGNVTVKVPTLRLTYKTDVKIVIYRWSVANQTYYQVTSITTPTLNNKSVDFISYGDADADAAIVGNNILYTTGGVLEDTGGPACTATTLFDNRLWCINAEDRNLLNFSKQVIEATPVEMSDLLSIFVAPTTGSQGSTGPMECLFPMDDKLIISKKNAFYYINGSGPDNTGANAQYSQPIFITSTVGSDNQNSFVFTPKGLMFQSDKGIWLLSRGLDTVYVGAPVEKYNQYRVNSAVNIPGANQARFTLSNGITLVYDYFYEQWSTFSGVPAISSTLYEGLHTYINSSGMVSQETPGIYLDNGNPVLLSFLTSWINLAGLQGYQRAYFFYLLGQYLTPHKLNLNIAYDYNESPTQSTLITPDNFAPNYGVSSPYGQESSYGGPGNIEQWRVFLTKQRCQSFQINLSEIYDQSLGAPSGRGLTLSGLNLIVAIKKGWIPISAANSIGGNT